MHQELSTFPKQVQNRQQREAGMFAAVRHYTHLAHHSATLPDQIEFTRSEAQLILQLTAACLGYGVQNHED
jgi:hypothetical protein